MDAGTVAGIVIPYLVMVAIVFFLYYLTIRLAVSHSKTTQYLDQLNVEVRKLSMHVQTIAKHVAENSGAPAGSQAAGAEVPGDKSPQS